MANPKSAKDMPSISIPAVSYTHLNYFTLIKTLKFLYVYKVEERTTVSQLSFLLLVYYYIRENMKNHKTKLF